ncbi:MAG: hypothetical protein WBQ18_12790 [Solirubrobacteraceae bacterium]
MLFTAGDAGARVTHHRRHSGHALSHTRRRPVSRRRRGARHRPATVRIARKHGTRALATTVGSASAWSEPALSNPTTITLSDATRNLALPQNQDYILQCPSHQLSLTYALSVWGGHNVVLQNCDFNITTPDWAAHLKDQAGTLFVRNVHFGGAHLTGGVQLQEPGATVVMRDVLFDTVHGSYTTNHAECLQTWSGPARLLIDGLTCSTTYQGLFLLPNQWDSRTRETVWDLRNIDIAALGAYALWLGNVQPSNRGSIPVWHLQNVYVSGPGEPRNWDGTSDANTAWAGVVHGRPAAGHFVSARGGGATGADDATAPAALATER